MTPTPPFDYTSARPAAEQAVSENYAAAILNLEPIFTSLIPDIARALVRTGGTYRIADLGTLNHANPRYSHSLNKVRDTLTAAGALQVTLDLEQAENLGDELHGACESPPECAYPGCDWLVEKTGHFCAPHSEARP